jgi:hypothetical protein
MDLAGMTNWGAVQLWFHIIRITPEGQLAVVGRKIFPLEYPIANIQCPMIKFQTM